MGGLLASLLVAMQIHATGDCPSVSDVVRRLGPLLGDGPEVGATDVATIERDAGGLLRVALADADGRLIGERRFPTTAPCREQAETVAVTLAIWEAQIHPEISLRLERLSPEAAAPAPPADTGIATPAPVRGSVRWAPSLGISIGGDWQADSLAPVARVELASGTSDSRWRIHLAAVAAGRHTRDFPPGQTRWWRGALAISLHLDVARRGRAALTVGAGVAAGMVSIAGAGFAVDRTSRSADVGSELQLRAEWRPGRVRPWVGAAVTGWWRGQGLAVEGAAASSTLPRIQPMLLLGTDFLW